MPGRIHSDTLFLHHLLHVYAFREYTHVFTCSVCCAQRWPYDKNTSMNYHLLPSNITIELELYHLRPCIPFLNIIYLSSRTWL